MGCLCVMAYMLAWRWKKRKCWFLPAFCLACFLLKALSCSRQRHPFVPWTISNHSWRNWALGLIKQYLQFHANLFLIVVFSSWKKKKETVYLWKMQCIFVVNSKKKKKLKKPEKNNWKNQTVKKNRLNHLKFWKNQPVRFGFGFISLKPKKPNRT
jgi:hypothetical protein